MKKIKPHIVLKTVSKETNVSINNLRHGTRDRTITDSRHIFRKYACQYGATEELAAKVINCNHSTVNSSKKKFKELYATDKEFRDKALKVFIQLLKL